MAAYFLRSKFVLLAFIVAAFDLCCEAKTFYTPLNKGYEFACVAENLKDSSTYYCDSNGNIRCLPGWTDPHNHCKTPVCEVNNRTCVNGNCSKPFTCDCEVGWWGQFCEKCVRLPGCVNGFCNRSLECICKPGWKGMNCDKPDCPDCKHGECIMPGMCACHPGWSGPNCTECEPRLDCKYGRCVDEPFQCKCFSKYQGVSCEQPICKEGCHPEHGYCKKPEQCWCKPGWTGPNCTECVPYWNCVNGKCIDNPWECICDDGFTGPDCNSTGNIDGSWGKWTAWSDCSTTCGAGLRKRTRKCDYPAPSGNGTYCSHDGSSCDDFEECSLGSCPGSNGTDSTTTKPHKPGHNWDSDSYSAKTSEGNYNQPGSAQLNSGLPQDFFDDSTIQQLTNDDRISRQSVWTEWTAYSECSVTCGGGFQDRTRECLADDLNLCGNVESEERSPCNTQACPTN